MGVGVQGDICFFSSTGNSFAIARELSETLGCRLVPICDGPELRTLTPGARLLGFVFPVYHASYGGSGLPHLVRDFISTVGDLSGRDVFVVCTHSGTPGDTIGHAKELIESHHGRLRVAMDVQMSVPRSPWQKLSYMITKKPMGSIRNEQRKQLALYRAWERRRDVLLTHLAGEHVSVDVLSGLKRRLWEGLSATQQQLVLKRYQHLAQSAGTDLDELFMASDASFRVNERCNGCGTCAAVCPVSNIEVEDRPRWNHRCELCYACYQWCPREAITGEIVEFEKRYHHPDVSLRDMVGRKHLSADAGPLP